MWGRVVQCIHRGCICHWGVHHRGHRHGPMCQNRYCILLQMYIQERSCWTYRRIGLRIRPSMHCTIKRMWRCKSMKVQRVRLRRIVHSMRMVMRRQRMSSACIGHQRITKWIFVLLRGLSVVMMSSLWRMVSCTNKSFG